jgi:K(+)-stimulated pyrophosphate-energized sodium pump
MKEISDYIYEGLAFLKAETVCLPFVIEQVLFWQQCFIFHTTNILIVVAFIWAFFSAYAGNIGMKIATKTNVRTTQAHSLASSIKSFFSVVP